MAVTPMSSTSEPMLALPSGARPRPKHVLPVGVALAGAGGAVGYGALLAAWVNLRHFNQPWPPRPVVLVNYPGSMLFVTILMAVVTAQWGTWAARRDLHGQSAAGFGFTIGFGLAFLNMLWFFGKDLKMGANSSPFATLMYALLAVTGVLAIVGIGALVTVLARVAARLHPETTLAAARAVTIYWEFLAVSWTMTTLIVWRPISF